MLFRVGGEATLNLRERIQCWGEYMDLREKEVVGRWEIIA